MHPEGSGGGRELGGVETGETIIKIHHVRNKELLIMKGKVRKRMTNA